MLNYDHRKHNGCSIKIPVIADTVQTVVDEIIGSIEMGHKLQAQLGEKLQPARTLNPKDSPVSFEYTCSMLRRIAENPGNYPGVTFELEKLHTSTTPKSLLQSIGMAFSVNDTAGTNWSDGGTPIPANTNPADLYINKQRLDTLIIYILLWRYEDGDRRAQTSANCGVARRCIPIPLHQCGLRSTTHLGSRICRLSFSDGKWLGRYQRDVTSRVAELERTREFQQRDPNRRFEYYQQFYKLDICKEKGSLLDIYTKVLRLPIELRRFRLYIEEIDICRGLALTPMPFLYIRQRFEENGIEVIDKHSSQEERDAYIKHGLRDNSVESTDPNKLWYVHNKKDIGANAHTFLLKVLHFTVRHKLVYSKVIFHFETKGTKPRVGQQLEHCVYSTDEYIRETMATTGAQTCGYGRTEGSVVAKDDGTIPTYDEIISILGLRKHLFPLLGLRTPLIQQAAQRNRVSKQGPHVVVVDCRNGHFIDIGTKNSTTGRGAGKSTYTNTGQHDARTLANLLAELVFHSPPDRDILFVLVHYLVKHRDGTTPDGITGSAGPGFGLSALCDKTMRILEMPEQYKLTDARMKVVLVKRCGSFKKQLLSENMNFQRRPYWNVPLLDDQGNHTRRETGNTTHERD
jgi:hypothetical protein